MDEDTLFRDMKGFVTKALKVIFDQIRRFMITGGMHVSLAWVIPRLKLWRFLSQRKKFGMN